MHPISLHRDVGTLTVTSKAFHSRGFIPARFTCDGENVSPPLQIENIPADAKSMVIIFEDPDARGSSWLHWLVWNIPVMKSIRENEIPGDQGINDFGQCEYGGPCPPSGIHRYVLRIYALDGLLDLKEGSGRTEVESAMEKHIIAVGEMTALYGRARK